MSGNPPRPPGGNNDDDFQQHVVKVRATLGCLEHLATLSPKDRMSVCVTLIGSCDEKFAELIMNRMTGGLR